MRIMQEEYLDGGRGLFDPSKVYRLLSGEIAPSYGTYYTVPTWLYYAIKLTFWAVNRTTAYAFRTCKTCTREGGKET